MHINTCFFLPRRLRQIPLSSAEEMYADLRDRNFNAVGPALSRRAKTVSAQFDERHDTKTVRELKQFVDRIPQLKVRLAETACNTLFLYDISIFYFF